MRAGVLGHAVVSDEFLRDEVASDELDSNEARDALVRRDSSLPGLGMLLDADRLSAALGEDVRLTRVRYKPASSVVVAFQTADASGWAASYTHDDKPAKTLARATADRPVRRIAGLPHAIIGGVFADRALRAGLRAVERREPGALQRATVLRHNPHRRVLLRVGEHVVKVAAGGSGAPGEADLGALASQGVPLLVPEHWGAGVTATTHWGIGDLSTHGSDEHAALAGAALAALHRGAVSAGEAPGIGGAPSIRTELAAAVAGLVAIDPDFEAPAARIAAAAPTARAHVPLHGDFSADQVLVGDGIRLIDFDRATTGDPHRDLGSFFAAQTLATGGEGRGAALLHGYRESGGVVDDETLRQWLAAGLLLRAVEPFRTARAGWHGQVRRILTFAERMLP